MNSTAVRVVPSLYHPIPQDSAVLDALPWPAFRGARDFVPRSYADCTFPVVEAVLSTDLSCLVTSHLLAVGWECCMAVCFLLLRYCSASGSSASV